MNKILIPLILLLASCSTGPIKSSEIEAVGSSVQQPKEFQDPLAVLKKIEEQEFSEHRPKKPLLSIAKTIIEQQLNIRRILSKSGSLVLEPGKSYSFNLKSFCISSGIEQPVKGDGYIPGVLISKDKLWLSKLSSEFVEKGVSQENTQALIWSLLAGLKFDEIGLQQQQTVTRFYSDAAIRFGNSQLEEVIKDKISSSLLTSDLPIDKIEKLKSILSDSEYSFADLENIYAPKSKRISPIDAGWVQMPNGYYLKLNANGYDSVDVKIYVPANLKNKIVFEPSKVVALPKNGQRLLLSNQVNKTEVEKSLETKINKYLSNYSGMSLSMYEAILKNPLDALTVYLDSEQADLYTYLHFKRQDIHNTQGDAFRHYVWAGLSAKDVGYEKAKLFLDAHEDWYNNPNLERQMDTYNNQMGLKFFQDYKGKDYTDDLVKEGLLKIKNKELKWLK